MKLILASYFESEKHGSGRKIGISPSKPKDVECEFKFEPLDPGQLYWDYHRMKKTNPDLAVKVFIEEYTKQCNKFVEEVLKDAEEQKKTVNELLNFQNEDNFLSWEKGENPSHRNIAADCLRKLGYDVEER